MGGEAGGGGGAASALDETVTNFCLEKAGGGPVTDPADDLTRAVYLLGGLKNREGIDYLVQTALAADEDRAVSAGLDETFQSVGTHALDRARWSTEHQVRPELP